MNNVTIQEVIEWVQSFHKKSTQALTPSERKEQKKYATLVQTPKDKFILSSMLDESTQIRNNRKLARQIKEMIDQNGSPSFFTPFEKFLMSMFAKFGYQFDSIAMPIFKDQVRKETANVIIDEARPKLTEHLAMRRKQGIIENVNLLGEVVLGNGEADHRYKHYLRALEEPDITYISIKLSGIYAQIHPLNYEQSKKDLCDRVAAIFQKAIDHPYKNFAGKTVPKFVNLDMEEYKNTHLTMDVFKTVLSMPQFKNYTAGIVIQAYLPDAWELQSELLEFAKNRFENGGAPLKMRLVKGANLQMEEVISSLKHWTVPVYDTKVAVDANYLKILDRALQPDNIRALRVGVASHNLFTIGYAFILSQKNMIQDYVSFEMLEGMANHLARTMREMDKQLILYTPVVKKEHFLNAISYLVRRLDENTSKDNFLRYSFNLKPGSQEWNFLVDQFTTAYNMRNDISSIPKRKQNRTLPAIEKGDIDIFVNEADTDFDLLPQKAWVKSILQKWQKGPDHSPVTIPVQLGKEGVDAKQYKEYTDRCQNSTITTYRMGLCNEDQMDQLLDIANKDNSGWSNTSLAERKRILMKSADLLNAKRGDLIGCMAAVTGKTIMEGDVEVSEAVDFCRFYPITMAEFDKLETVNITPKGVILVVSPWNFPIAIPTGGVAAALAGGNRVILKPATVAAPIAWEFARCFWEAGVPQEALQVVVCDGSKSLNKLITSPVIKHIILTGGTDTAFSILKENPKCPLSAETGGKNAIIVTECGDQDHAIQNIITSTFSNAGQKCSACSLLILEKGVYNDPGFKKKLTDAVTSIQCGSPWNTSNIVGPMITNNNEKLKTALELQPGEEWLVAPCYVDQNKYILRPCVKWGVKKGNFTFENEIFAPVLSVVCADSLDEAIELVNSLEFGLTSGIQTLSKDERALWKSKIEAGNLYINRGITGAIVNRQPFGGMKRSAFGGGLKAGGVNYVSSFVRFTEKAITPASDEQVAYFSELQEIFSDANDLRSIKQAIKSFAASYDTIFCKETDVNNLYGEENTTRYLPLKSCCLRITGDEKPVQVALIALGAYGCKTPLTISVTQNYKDLEKIQKIAQACKCTVKTEDEASFINKMGDFERIRTCNDNLSDAIWNKAGEKGLYIACTPPISEGRIELLHYLKEQSISYEYHRYGSFIGE
ncbi:MAG: bifunctional proline dehydrogenase/L-glutamate gamma-semialdehyde dehydrogenase [Bacteroidales bacterium]